MRFARRSRIAMLVAFGAAGVAAVAGLATGEAPPVGAAASAPLATYTVGGEGARGERLFDGLVEAVRSATLVAQTAGRVAEVLRDADDPVKSGEVILRLAGVEQRARLAQAEQALAEASARATDARAEYARLASVYEQKLVAKSAFDRAVADRDAAEARLSAARAGVAAAREEAGYTELRAPYAGVVTRRYVEPGEAVQPGQPLAEVVAPEALRVSIEVPQSVAEALRKGPKATVHAGTQRIVGERVTVFPAASSGSNTVRVRVDLPRQTAGLYPGMFAKVGFGLAGPAALSIPAASVVRRSELSAVYVVDAANQPRLRQVRLGRQQGADYEVLAGLSAGERVALDPVRALERLQATKRDP
ncbi:MAG: efflux RND transporter periplasmic adaptor subunit [Gammaproteobacteria bacterium]|nr:efflux RND transporter periplasmic adaptor subunit [Gammaproteobacteria bacterium]